MYFVQLSYWSLGAVSIRQRHGQPFTVLSTGPDPGEGVGALDVGVAAPR